MATVIFGLFLHGAILLPALLWALTRRNPFVFAWRTLNPLMTVGRQITAVKVQ